MPSVPSRVIGRFGKMRLSMRTRINAFVNSTLTKAGYQLRKLPRNDERPLPRDMEPDILEIIRQVRPFTMTSPERIYGLVKAVDYVCQNAIDGDIDRKSTRLNSSH